MSHKTSLLSKNDLWSVFGQFLDRVSVIKPGYHIRFKTDWKLVQNWFTKTLCENRLNGKVGLNPHSVYTKNARDFFTPDSFRVNLEFLDLALKTVSFPAWVLLLAIFSLAKRANSSCPTSTLIWRGSFSQSQPSQPSTSPQKPCYFKLLVGTGLSCFMLIFILQLSKYDYSSLELAATTYVLWRKVPSKSPTDISSSVSVSESESQR